MNVALYGQGGRKWAMTERGRRAVRRDAESLQIGPSCMAWNGTTLTVAIDEVTAPFPSRIRGTIKLHPHGVTARAFPVDGSAEHRWWPIAPVARFEVQLDNPSLRWSGSGYLDSNNGCVPLERTFKRWDWSRTVEADSTAVLYDVTARNGLDSALAMRFRKDGTATDIELPRPAGLPGTLWGVARSTRSDDGAAHLRQTLEDGPFYSRSLIETRLGSAPVTAIHESLSLDRFSKLWVQGLLPFRMPRRRR